MLLDVFEASKDGADFVFTAMSISNDTLYLYWVAPRTFATPPPPEI